VKEKIHCSELIFCAENEEEYKNGLLKLPDGAEGRIGDKSSFEKKILKRYLKKHYVPKLPVCLHKSERPDFYLCDNCGQTGFEIARITNQRQNENDKFIREKLKDYQNIVRPADPPDGVRWNEDDCKRIIAGDLHLGVIGHPATFKEINCFIKFVELKVNNKVEKARDYDFDHPVKIVFDLQGADIGYDFDDDYCHYTEEKCCHFLSEIKQLARRALTSKVVEISYILCTFHILIVRRDGDFVLLHDNSKVTTERFCEIASSSQGETGVLRKF